MLSAKRWAPGESGGTRTPGGPLQPYGRVVVWVQGVLSFSQGDGNPNEENRHVLTTS
jgi:hypothetical protein